MSLELVEQNVHCFLLKVVVVFGVLRRGPIMCFC